MAIITEEKMKNLDRDINDVDLTLNTKSVITPRYGEQFYSLPLAVQKVMETGGFEPFLTEAQLLASIPTVSPKAAKALDTKKIWYWGKYSDSETVDSWHDTGLSELDQANKFALSGKNNIPMLWFFEPYYEFDSDSLYFKPKPRLAPPNDYCFYIRASKYPDFQMRIDDFYSQLRDQVASDSFKVTSPLGVTDCIKFDEHQCLYFDHDLNKFIYGYRSDVVAQNRTLMIHKNFHEIGPCIEQANILNSLTLNSFAETRNLTNAYRYASVANSRREEYHPNIPENLKKDSNGLVLYDSVKKKLYVPADTVIYTDRGIFSTNAFEIDVKAVFEATGTSLLKVYFDTETKTFVSMRWSAQLTKAQEKSFYLFCSLRHAIYEDATKPDLLVINGTFKYRIDGAVDGVPIDGNKATVTPGAYYFDTALSFPNYDSVNNTLTFPFDTILKHRGNIWIIKPEPIKLTFTDIQTSAMRVYWDVIENKFITTRYDTLLNSSQKYRYVTVCAIRDRGNFWEEDNKGRIAIDIGCPYAIDGVIYGIKGGTDGGIVQNRLDDTIKAVAHRGYSIEAPENTLPAYILAKKKGYSYCETDISFTSDNVPMLLHDSSIDRTSNGSGELRNLTFDEVRQYDFGSWKGEKYAGTKIPTFAEFMQLCFKLGLHPYCEWKEAEAITAERAQQLADIVRRSSMRGNMSYISFSYEALVQLRAHDPYARLGYLADATQVNVDKVDALKTGTNEVFLDCWYGGATRDIMDYALDKDVPVEIWTVNDPNIIVNYANIGVSGVTTDSLNIRQILNESVGI